MNSIRSATAGVKETVQNVVAKADMKVEANKVASTEKAERKAATDKAGKHEAKAKRHTKEAEILRAYEVKRNEHAAEKESKKAGTLKKKDDKHATAESAIYKNSTPMQTTGAGSPATDAAAREDLAGDHSHYTPAPAPAPASVPPPVPMHGSGVPTHSALHSEQHDVNSTQTMGGSPNTGSYM